MRAPVTVRPEASALDAVNPLAAACGDGTGSYVWHKEKSGVRTLEFPGESRKAPK